VVVLDIGLPGLDGVELTRRLRASAVPARVVILTIQTLHAEVLRALAAGADAYCVKASDPAGLIAAVKIAAEGGAYFDPHIAHIVLEVLGSPRNAVPPKESPLTPRELQILRLIADGARNVEIAERFRLGLGTVKDHVRTILKKMAATDRTQAAVNALRRGLL
jgi:NarL family two-component system response regulator LiaR